MRWPAAGPVLAGRYDMRLSRNELIAKLSLGEDSLLECKEVRFSGAEVRGPSQHDLADEIAAFANSRVEGTLILGVEDSTREVLGIPLGRLDAVESRVRQAVQDSVKPPLAPIIERLTLPDALGVEKAVLRVDVEPSLFVHQSPGGYLHRVGSSKRPMPPDQLARLFQQRSQSRLIRFDETVVMAAQTSDLDGTLLKRFEPPQRADPGWLAKMALVRNGDDGTSHPTVAGLLLASPNPERFLSGAFIQAVAYAGDDIAPSGEQAIYQLDAADLTGPLDLQIFAACRFVSRNSRMAAFKLESGGRVDQPQFDPLAIFEAITNAVAHRDYSMPGSKIRLRLFTNRLEIFTPGMLPNTMTPESMPLRQACRNELIASLLARCPIDSSSEISHRSHIMDRRGEGVPLILSRSEALSGKLPIYRLIDDSELLLTIPAAA
jgi:ATP-dependent DNA helicase RecG